MIGSVLIGVLFIGLIVWRVIMSSPDNIGKAGERRVARKLDWLSKEYIGSCAKPCVRKIARNSLIGITGCLSRNYKKSVPFCF